MCGLRLPQKPTNQPRACISGLHTYLGHGLSLSLSSDSRHISIDEHLNRLLLGGLQLVAVLGSEALCEPIHHPSTQAARQGRARQVGTYRTKRAVRLRVPQTDATGLKIVNNHEGRQAGGQAGRQGNRFLTLLRVCYVDAKHPTKATRSLAYLCTIGQRLAHYLS